jgi:methyl-accepting chemotaxis protein
MSDGINLGNLMADRRIGTKIAMGFAVVLAILAVSSVSAWLAFGRVSGAVDQYVVLVTNSGIFRDINLTVAQYRGHVREYVYSNNEETAASAIRDADSLHKLVATGLAHVTNPERHALLEELTKQADAYGDGFQHVREMNVQQAKLTTDVLNPTGQQITEQFSLILAAATKQGNVEAAGLAAEGRRLSLVAQIDVNKRLASNDENDAKAAEQQFVAIRQVLTQLDAATKTSNQDIAKLVDTYHDAFQRAAGLDAGQIALVNGAMRKSGDAMEQIATKAKESNLAAQAAIEEETIATTAGGSSRVTIFGIAGLALGVVMAWLIGRGISRPVVSMCVAMRALAGGNRTVEIPGVGRKDEIGQMADTVVVFRDSMAEAERLREDNERHKAEAEAERKAGMLRLADTFEAGIKGVVNSVASQATEMQSAAQTMTQTAEMATKQATAVAASVEEASANVQTVATAAEELSASVLEIGRQVEQSSKIANQAVGEADRTNTTVEGLNRTAQRIGEVVQLLEPIAGQTNLLALNATIEAARAGDAGKGFAVVASEVKSLASQTAKATEEIRAQIGEIQGATGQTVEAIRTIGATIRQMSEIATTIASSVEEQGAATREIASNVHQAAQGTGDIATNIEGVSRAASDTGAAASQVLSAAGELSRQSETLRRDVDEFVATVRAA